MSVIYTPRKPEVNGRMIAILGVLYVLLTILFLRLWYFQVVKAPMLVERAEASRAQQVLQLAPRGLIEDRNGKLIGEIRREIVVNVLPSALNVNEDVIPRVIELLKTDPHLAQDKMLERKIRAKLAEARRTPFVASPIFVGASIDAGTRIAESPDEFPGITIDTLPMRSYTDTKSFTHVLGYVWLHNEADIKRIRKEGYDPAEYVGKAGIEKAYEADLMGQPGAERVEMDAKGHPVRLVGRDEATPGKKLVLTLDADLQAYATTAMEEGHLAPGKPREPFVGGLVAMDPATGEILSLVSTPTFDSSLFQGGMTDAEWKKLVEDPDKPLMNRAISERQSPGSTFKIITSLAAYETGKFDPTERIDCPGGFYLNGRRLCKCLGVHGLIDFKDAFEKSCNTYFATLGYNVGPAALRKAALEMGLGEKTGIEIDGEARGTVPTEHWLTHRAHPLSWHGGDTVNLAIGQGWINASPIQMCDVAAMVANEGVNYKPHLVREIVDPLIPSRMTRVAPDVLHQVNASPEFWKTLKDAMLGVMVEGTGRGVDKIPGIQWGGKTGSTEHGNKAVTKTHAWFVGIAPIDHPKIVICVLVESGGHGGDVAAPVAEAVVQHYLVSEPEALAKLAAKSAAALAASKASARSPLASAAR
jgi:penicillin-binding protein 2